MEAGKLLEHLPHLRENANLAERRELLMATLDAVYVDTVEETSGKITHTQIMETDRLP